MAGTESAITCYEVQLNSCFTIAFQFMSRKKKKNWVCVSKLPNTFVQFQEINNFGNAAPTYAAVLDFQLHFNETKSVFFTQME